MVVKGEGGEKYTLNSKNKRTYRTYTDYQVGNGKYIARILDRKVRNNGVEDEVEQALRSGSYYDGELPLNLLYTGKKFVGFLYEGNGDFLAAAPVTDEDDIFAENASAGKRQLPSGIGDGEQIYIIGIQVIMAVLMAVIGKTIIYPMLERFMSQYQDSTVIGMLYYLDYNGVPAIVAGIILQIVVFTSFKERISNVIYSGLTAMLANLVGMVLWTLIVMLLMMIVQGAVEFIMEYLAYIILIVGGVIWLKKKFRIR